MNRNFSFANCLTALRFSSRSAKCLGLLLAGIFSLTTAQAQFAGTGAISGTVTDQSGAAIPNASIDVMNVDTNVHTVRTSTSAGDYNVNPLQPGAYTLTVTASGFQMLVQKNITVNALETVAVQAKLTVGSVNETVTVTDQPPVLETTNATLGGVMDQQMYSALPLLMGAGGNPDQRRATDFANLMPGVQVTYASNSTSNSTDASGSVNGSNPGGGTSDIYIDGLDLPEADGIGDPRFTWTAIGVDAINQFQVQTVGIPAQYAGQGIQNYSVKSGGNAFHGSLYEYLRNTVLDSWGTNNKTPTLTGAAVPVGGSCTSAALSASTPWCSLKGLKPKEIMNEYGIVLSGPIIKNKLFLFYNYGQYRYQAGPKPQTQTLPTLAMMGYNSSGQLQANADFSGYSAANAGFNIYDPATQTVQNCTNAQCVRTPFAGNMIPMSRVSQAAKYFNTFLLPVEAGVNQTAYTNNVVAGYNSGLSNWYQTGRLDYTITKNQQLGIIVAFGRQSSTGPNSSGAANELPPPFNTGQAYHPVTNIDILKHTWTLSPHLVNQFALAFGRYQSFSVTPNELPQYAASQSGLLNTPQGQASFFPGLTYTGTDGPLTAGGYSENNKVNNTFNVTDNVQWQLGSHSLTLGGQYVDVQFNYTKNETNSSPMTYTFTNAQTEGYNASGVANASSGSPWASYMLGAVNTSSVTVGVPTLGTRWEDPSFWAQDDWKISSKLTMNIGIRWDIFPSVREAHDIFTWINPKGVNSNSGNLGTLAFAGGNPSDGYHTGLHNPASIWYKNVAPRLGLAYQVDTKTVLKASWGMSFARGDWTSGQQGGSPSVTGLTPAAAAASVGSNQPQFYWDGTACGGGMVAGDGFTPCGWTGSVSAPSTTLPAGASLAEFGATQTATLKGANAVTMTYFDPYLGSRTPEYINWSFGFQRQLTSDMSVSVSYVGSQGHFLAATNAKYQTNNKLPESYAGLANYNVVGATQTPCTGLACTTSLIGQKATVQNIGFAIADGYTPMNGFATPANYYGASDAVSSYLVAYPQYSGVTDATSFVANTNWNALEISFRQRASHGLDWMLNYTWSKNIDDDGTYRVYDNPRLDRSLSAADVPHNLVATAVYALPLGRGHAFGEHAIYRSIVSDWSVSDIVTIHSGQPIIITAIGCGSGGILNTCMPSLVPNQKGRQYQWGKTATGQHINWDPSSPNFIGKVQYVNPAAFNVAINGTSNLQAVNVGAGSAFYTPGNAPRAGALGMLGPGFFDDDLAVKRTFPLYRDVKLQVEADVANLTNHVNYQNPTGAVQSGSNTAFGTVAKPFSGYNPRDVQLAARINW